MKVEGPEYIRAHDFSPKDSVIGLVDRTGLGRHNIQLLDVKTKQVLTTITGFAHSIRFSPYGDKLAILTEGGFQVFQFKPNNPSLKKPLGDQDENVNKAFADTFFDDYL